MSTRRPWRWRRRRDTDFRHEIQAHLELEADRLVAEGIAADEARQRAQRAFGNVTAAQERFYERSRWAWFEHVRQDLRYAARTLWRSPTFVATTVLTLAVALGLVTALFGVFNAYVLRPFAIPDPHQIFQLAWRAAPDDAGATFTWLEYQEIRQRADLFDGVAAHRFQVVSSAGGQLYAAFISGTYFDTIKPRLRLGRGLADFDAATPGAAPVAVLSDHGWARIFDRDPSVLGRRLTLHGQEFAVVGVLRPEFSGLDEAPLDLWLPLTMLPVTTGKDFFGPAAPRELTLFARLRRDVTAVHAEQALRPFAAQVATTGTTGGRSIDAAAVRASLLPRATPNPLTLELMLLLSPIVAAFGLVLVAACANVSSVMLARGLNRQREIGIRLAVGAGRGRIVQQLLTEAAIIAGLAGAAGLALASIALPVGRWVFFATLPPTLAELARVGPMTVDVRVFGFALTIATIVTLACALLPALQSTRLRLTSALRGDVTERLRGSALRNLLVIGQVTVSLVLLVAAVTLARNGVSVAGTELGFDAAGVFSVNQRGAGSTLIAAAARRLAAETSPEAVAITSSNPLFGGLGSIGAVPSGRSDTLTTSYMFASPEYFPLLRIPVLRGRAFSVAEAQSEAHVAVVSEGTARLFWADAEPVGRTVRLVARRESQADAVAGYADVLVIGVAKDVVTGMVYEGTDRAIVYLPTSASGAHAGALLVRRPHADRAGRDALLQVLERVSVNPAAFDVLPLAEITAILLYPLHMASWIGSLLGAVALLLCVSGLYGLLMYVLGQRTREIGVRMALGANAGDVVRLIVRHSLRVVGIGAGIGVSLTYAGLRLLDAAMPLQMGKVSVVDVWAFAATLLLIAGAAVVASYAPARRATRVDPCSTLRADA